MSTIQDVAERGGTKRSATKVSVSRLVAAGLVEKNVRKDLGYVRIIYRRTEAGQKALEGIE